MPDGDIPLLEGMATTRAIRRFRPDPIPDEDLDTILWHASRAPSGSNRQPFRFIVLRDGERARAARSLLGDAFRAEWQSKRAHDGYDTGSGLDPSSRKARTARAMQRFVDEFEQTPVVVLACHHDYRPSTVFDGANVYPACQNLLLAARALGYGGVMTIALGRPEGSHGPVRRRPIAEIVYEDAWGVPAPWASDPPGTRFAGGPTRTS